MLTPEEKIQLFFSLFKGRDDVFAKRWEKADGTRSGYSPVCENEWKEGVCIKAQKKQCTNCAHQKYPKLNDEYLRRHLEGKIVLGIYPLLSNNTSHILVADFDEDTWQKDTIAFYEQCVRYDIPAYVERSRSGNGAHVWWFFSTPCTATQSRELGFQLLKLAGLTEDFVPLDSFDRFIPNQDYLRKGAIGNLVALPLQWQARQQHHSEFVDPRQNFKAYPDQWEFLKNVHTIDPEKIEKTLHRIEAEKQESKPKLKDKKLHIIIASHLSIPAVEISPLLKKFLTEQLNFVNAEYLVKKKMHASVYGVEKYFRLIEKESGNVLIPRGFLSTLKQFCEDHLISYVVEDKRYRCDAVHFSSTYSLRPYQLVAVEEMLSADDGILVAPPGSGKTVMGLELIARRGQPALILVHTKQIFEQWVQRIQDMLDIPKAEIGQVRGGNKKWGKQITIAMVQTLSRMPSLENHAERFGTIVVDECHHMPARMFRTVITQFRPYHLYGLTATPERKYNDEKLINAYLGDVVYEMQSIDTVDTGLPKSDIDIRVQETAVTLPFSVRTDILQMAYKVILFDTKRNEQIVEDVKQQLQEGKRCLIMTERKEHADILQLYLKKQSEVLVVTGDSSKSHREILMKQLHAGDFHVAIVTGQLLGEGTDIPHFDVLFLVFPFSSAVKLKQYIGRLQRGNTGGVVYDYRDTHIGFFETMYKKRAQIYKNHFQ
ncbi:MAG TPA: DEAD/DEAH box helicase family protein [Patescibacteria group bacterium]|nr:DEAD/DEAH box helicase family protein [Patescibacteria group bacterium]